MITNSHFNFKIEKAYNSKDQNLSMIKSAFLQPAVLWTRVLYEVFFLHFHCLSQIMLHGDYSANICRIES